MPALAPLTGREKDKDTLLQWVRQGRNARIRLLSGPGGVGKSRLAAEVADELRAEGWTAGFIRPNDPIVVPLRRAGLFLVVDYPEEHQDEVRTLLREIASRELRDVPVRLLLLSRRGGDRWFDLVESAHAGELMDAQEVGLSRLAAAEPERVFSEALGRLAARYRRPTSAISDDAVRNWIALNPGLHGLPLLLTAAAIHAFLNPDAALGLGGASVVQALADRERTRLGSVGRAAGLGDRSAARIVALAAVPGSLGAADLRRLADPTLEIGLPAPDRVTDAVISLPWWQKDHVSSLEPDLMAAALLVRVLSERPDRAPDWLWAVIEDAPASQLIERLGRLVFDTLTLNNSTAGITQHLAKVISGNPSRAHALEFFTHEVNLPFGLASFAADVTGVVLTSVTDKTVRARYLNDLSVHLSNAGGSARALEAACQAVAIQRELMQVDPTRYSPDLAISLNNLSGALSTTGDHEGALAAIREAVKIRRRQAQENSVHFPPDLAASLTNLSNRLSEAGDQTAALAAIREAVELHRGLAGCDPKHFAPELALVLNNLSNRLSDAGDSVGALEAIREAVETYRRLTRETPARFTPYLGGALNTLSNRLKEVGGTAAPQEAMAAITEAVGIFRPLARDNPARFGPDLVKTLNNLSNRLAGAGEGTGALSAIREAVTPVRFTMMAAADPGASSRWLHGLAISVKLRGLSGSSKAERGPLLVPGQW
jgi:tetratricopeptide (TPR) repeat protein